MPWNRTPGIQESHRQPHGPWSSGRLPEFLALRSVLTRLAETYARLWPVLRASGTADTSGRLSLCQALVARFRNEGALAPHLSPATATDILFSLTSPVLWHELVQTCGWDAARYRSH